MGQCHIRDGCRSEVLSPDGRMGDDGKCSVATRRTCFSAGGVVTTTLHYKKKVFTTGRGGGGIDGRGV